MGVGGTDLFVVNTSKFLRQAEFTGGINVASNLGIGRSSANAKLHIGNNSDSTNIGDATNPALQIGGSTTYRLGLYTTAEGGVIDCANGDDGLIFHTKTKGEAVRIASDGKVGISTASPRAVLDVEGDTRLKSYHEAPVTLTSSGQVVNIDLSKGQTFELTTTENIVEFRISNFVVRHGYIIYYQDFTGFTARTVA